MSAEARAVLDAAQPDDVTYTCFILSPADIAAGRLCRYGPGDASLPKVLLWGDSHAGRARRAFERLAQEHRFQLFFGGHMDAGR